MIVKGEGVTNSDPKYFQFVHTFDAEYFIGISELSFLSWVMNNFLRFALFNFKLLVQAQSDMCCNSFGIDGVLIAGTKR